MSGSQLIPNRQYKDRLFRFIFQDKRDLLSLYNAVNRSVYENPDELEIHTLDDVMYISMKNDVSFLIDNRLNLYEEQSTWNPNMPLRGLFYFARLYQGYVTDHQINVYSDAKVKLPFPQFVVFYIGQDRKFERRTLYLSDSFEKVDGQIPCLECTANVINIRPGYNENLVKSCRKLYEYSVLVCKVQDYISEGCTLSKAIGAAIDVCIHEGILDDFLTRYRMEVSGMIFSEYNEEFHRKAMEKEAVERGIKQGIKQGEEQVSLLYAQLLKMNRMDDLQRAVEDSEYRKQLMEEFHIGED